VLLLSQYTILIPPSCLSSTPRGDPPAPVSLAFFVYDCLLRRPLPLIASHSSLPPPVSSVLHRVAGCHILHGTPDSPFPVWFRSGLQYAANFPFVVLPRAMVVLTSLQTTHKSVQGMKQHSYCKKHRQRCTACNNVIGFCCDNIVIELSLALYISIILTILSCLSKYYHNGLLITI
jgi:hypothetical protein